ncbi:alanine/glycine:cation symporter family protein [Jonesiaceae bacterium BS-20]|uniref:Alanine/glycine:cation symporter family protein n=1 Tax=Jonesiaceae bacterium BS-20 TaxID=3120821 RepID=A0AAU7DXE8_9MICO
MFFEVTEEVPLSTAILTHISDFMFTYVLIFLLVGAGLFFTLRTNFVQVRHFKGMLKAIVSKEDSIGGISSFQAFATGMASRVGTGNIVGVAIALTVGGPGAIFWMWVVAFVGMATGFVEATLAQIFKVRQKDGTYRGGPAYYIRTGLGSKFWAVAFAVMLIFAYGFAFNMVQANTIADTLASNHSVPPWVTAVALIACAAPLLLRGIKPIAEFAGKYMPIIAGLYVGIALLIVLLNFDQLPTMFIHIFKSAFGLEEAVAGTGAGILAAMLNGTKRGLFSNEAGMGSAPNMAATATVSHPVKQGLIQSLGVFIDTIVVCSATAFMIMASGAYSFSDIGSIAGASLTNDAIVTALGPWAVWLTSIIIFVFAFTTLFGNYSYAEVNLTYLGASDRGIAFFRYLVLAGLAVGALLKLEAVWAIADIAMAFMATTNLVAIILLSKWFFGTLKDYEVKKKAGTTAQRFVGHENPHLPGNTPGDVWAQGASDVLASSESFEQGPVN